MSAHPIAIALLLILIGGVVSWLFSVWKRDVSFVDSLWSLFFVLAAVVYAAASAPLTERAILVLALVAVWALRLSIYITARNWGEPEDYRYQAIRANNEPGFKFKSLYIVFGLQGVLAWFISFPLYPALSVDAPLGFIDFIAVALWTIGFIFEAGGDYQLSRFKSDDNNKGRVLDTGLWRLTRHPNYFGDFCIWWSFYLLALPVGGWWTIASPLLMSVLLLKVSGVAMLEKTISDRRPAYADYIRRTNAFFPGRPKKAGGSASPSQRLMFSAIVGVVALGAASPTPAVSQPDEAREWAFNVYVGDKRIGTHLFRVSGNSGIREVRSEARFRYRILFIPAFRYDHDAAERWAGDCLVELRATTKTNGEQIDLVGERTTNSFRVENEDTAVELPECVMTFAYWNPDFLDQTRLLNPQTGEYLNVDIDEVGTEVLQVRGRSVEATRFQVIAENVALTLWYSADNEWLGLQSSTKNGQVIRYELS